MSLLAVASVPAPGLSAVPPAEIAPAVITVWSHENIDSSEFMALASVVNAFNRKQHVYRVELVSAIYREYDRWIRSAALNGTLPCVLNFDGPWLYEFVWSGYLQPLDQFASPELLRDMLPSVVAQGSYHGRLYSLSQYESALALWGNRRYLIQAGLRIPTLASPWTLQEFEDALEKLHALPEIEYAIDFNAQASNRTGRSTEIYTYEYAPILQGFGGDLAGREGSGPASGTLAGPRSIIAMKHLQQWFQRGWSQAGPLSENALPEGRAALSWYGNWGYPNYHRALGKDLILMPLPDFGHGVKTGIGGFTWGISSTCHNPRGAWEFLRFLLSPEAILTMSNATGLMPARRSALERSNLYGVNGPLRMLVRQLDGGFAVPRPETPAYGTITAAFAEAAVRIIGGGDVGSELHKAADRIDREVAQRHGYPHQ
jgi:multiple sugar transport system substrate-binding protein